MNVLGAFVKHPCLQCGACCATYRVAFHWSEADDAPGGQVPVALTAALRTHERVMCGTDSITPRCVALQGDVGSAASCGIYPLRPSVCREVLASWEFGAADAQCDKARLKHGLPVLTPADWTGA